ncbi:DNA polymerase III subunit beta [Micromonospora sp. RV43]|uniref:DNA polymerase III subunit beta n=1 Tax=Micromonospora sp. RV43 TaxID=1661387 RepID=UPI00064C2B15|nr:DNA polymerase III subunit beta [Micromonospora sp. RV43]
MKLRIDRDQFTDAVAWTAKALPTRPHIPVVAGVLLEAGGGELRVSGYDYETANRHTLSAAVHDTGAALVSGRLLAEITKSLPNKPVDLAAVGAHLELVCGASRFTLPTMPAEDYPALPAMPGAAGAVDAAAFAAAVAQVSVAAGRDDTLPLLTGVRVEVDGATLRLFATDRYRVAVRELAWEPVVDTNPTALVPARALHDTAKVLGQVSGKLELSLSDLARGEGLAGFAAGGRQSTSRLLDAANYPPVLSLFPKAANSQARVSTAGLVEVVKRIALVAERTAPVLLTFDGDALVVEAGGVDAARGSEFMDADFTGEPLAVGFNPQLLLDGLAHLGTPTVALSFVDAFKPAVFAPVGADGATDPTFRYLLMPIRVSR